MEFQLAFGVTDLFDVKEEVYGVFVLALLATIIALLVVIGIAFRSVASALRLAVSVALTMSWCYGGGVIVFGTSIFRWTDAQMASTTTVSFLGPVLTFSLVIGLCVDYDVFLTTRHGVIEYRYACQS